MGGSYVVVSVYCNTLTSKWEVEVYVRGECTVYLGLINMGELGMMCLNMGMMCLNTGTVGTVLTQNDLYVYLV